MGSRIDIGTRGRNSTTIGGSAGTPKYVGARAEVIRIPNVGVKIRLTDYKGTTEEVIAEAIDSIVSNADGSITFTLIDGRTFTTDSLTGPMGPIGPAGPQGERGSTGEAGPQGETGNGIADAELNSDYTLTLGFTDGTSYTTPSIRGATGAQGVQGPQGERGLQGEKGDPGEAFSIVKTYASIAEMNADYSGTDVEIGQYVMITSTVEDPDNAKVYIKGSQAYQFVVDMSGATGVKGDKGDRGERGEQGIQGPQGIQGIQGIQGERGETGPAGPTGPQGEPGTTDYNDLENKPDLSIYAEIDGSYDTLTAGALALAEPTEDTAPYLLRQSAGGDFAVDTLIGGSIAWNQMIKCNRASTTMSDVTITKVTGGYTLSGTASAPIERAFDDSLDRPNIIANHVYFWGGVKANSNITLYAFFTGVASTTTKDTIVKPTTAMANCNMGFDIAQGAQVNTTIYPTFIDLTATFGTEIADYVYGLEQSTAGSGIAWLKSYGFLGKDYYAYDTGSLVSVKTSAHVMRDEDDAIIGNYPLDSDLELRGIPKLSNGNLYYDGDEYTADGTVTRKYGIVDLGTLNYATASTGDRNTRFVTSDIPSLKRGTKNGIVVGFYNDNAWAVHDKSWFASTSADNFYIDDGVSTTIAQIRTALSGVYFVYELATPTTETADSFASPQIVDPNGTEEYVDTRDVPVPVGHRTVYLPNADGNKLEYLPPLADGQGSFLVEQSGTKMKLKKYDIPDAPTSDGTYTLKVTVTDGNPEYTWESEV